MSKFELHIPIKFKNSFAIDLISSQCSLSKSQIKQAIDKGCLWLTEKNKTKRVRKIKRSLPEHAELHFYYDEQVLSQKCPSATLLQDYQEYSIWYKPYGMLSQGSKWSDHCTVSRWAEKHLSPQRPAFIVHRLDRAATGLIILAHSKKAAKALSALFEHHHIKKHYQIITHGKCAIGEATRIDANIDQRSAVSHFTGNAYDENADISLFDVVIETGRKHQIRKHASHLGYPVVGDRLHGDNDKSYPDDLNLQLCSTSMKFQCPISNKPVDITLPDNLRLNLADTSQRLKES
ncbi:RluA family pseudouridine synthase [Thalassotalea fusca]